MILKGWNENVQARLKGLKGMNEHEFDTDEAYAYWIENGIPDAASDDDIRYIAENVEVYCEVVNAFMTAVKMDI